MKDIEEKCKDSERQNDIKIKVEDVKKWMKTLKWKSNGLGGIQGY